MPTQYKTIDGKICEVALLDLGQKLTSPGPLQLDGARKIWESALDGNKVTERERNSIEYILKSSQRGLSSEAAAFFDFWLKEKSATKTGAQVVEIGGEKCDRPMVQVADLFKRRARGGPLTVRAAEGVWFCALDGKGITRREKHTLDVISRRYDFEAPAKSFLEQKLEWLGMVGSVVGTAAPGEASVSAASEAILLRRPDAILLRRTDAVALEDLPPASALMPLFAYPGTASEEGLPSAATPCSPVASPAPGGESSRWTVRLQNWVFKSLKPTTLQVASDAMTRSEPASKKRKVTIDAMPRSEPASQKRLVTSDAMPRSEPASKKHRVSEAPTVTLQQLRDVFERCDRDKDGHINKRELIKSCREDSALAEFFGLPAKIRAEDGSRSKMEALWQEIDKDGDREIRWAELLAHYKHIVVDM